MIDLKGRKYYKYNTVTTSILDPESREILNGEESVNFNKLSRDNVNAVFSISRNLKKSAKILGADVFESGFIVLAISIAPFA